MTNQKQQNFVVILWASWLCILLAVAALGAAGFLAVTSGESAVDNVILLACVSAGFIGPGIGFRLAYSRQRADA
ncbi:MULTISPECIES: hypothetical protein [Marinobacter]|uniref:hypothetical protein n=1 Tax=Marinobacter TaxID=2742 RepID=UPI00059F30D7|nr:MULTISPECIES: hypothetical protein [Marinobacter]|tara:strand:+ start:594 stop:815 length:222 start_codon:yes stop_codon:yes gene_type:complete